MKPSFLSHQVRVRPLDANLGVTYLSRLGVEAPAGGVLAEVGNRSESRRDGTRLVLDRHGVRIDGLLAGNAFQSSQNTSVFILVALHRQTALFVTVGPGHTDKVLLGFAESHQSAKSKAHDTQGNGAADASVHILPVADLGNRGGGHSNDFSPISHETNFVLFDEHVQTGAGLGVRQRSAIVGDLVTGFRGQHRKWNCHAKQYGQKGFHVVSKGLERQETDDWAG